MAPSSTLIVGTGTEEEAGAEEARVDAASSLVAWVSKSLEDVVVKDSDADVEEEEEEEEEGGRTAIAAAFTA